MRAVSSTAFGIKPQRYSTQNLCQTERRVFSLLQSQNSPHAVEFSETDDVFDASHRPFVSFAFFVSQTSFSLLLLYTPHQMFASQHKVLTQSSLLSFLLRQIRIANRNVFQ